jgi:hypothetical protein
VVLIIGSEGSGKTRLVEHIARALDEGGWMEAFRLRYQRPAGVDDGYLGAVRELLSPFQRHPPAPAKSGSRAGWPATARRPLT